MRCLGKRQPHKHTFTADTHTDMDLNIIGHLCIWAAGIKKDLKNVSLQQAAVEKVYINNKKTPNFLFC